MAFQNDGWLFISHILILFFRAFLDGRGHYSTYDDDYDYDYQPRYHGGSRKDYLVEEVHCVEATLAKRRAELREADRLLQECEMDLKQAQNEAKSTVNQYTSAQTGFEATVQDLKEIEKRTHEAGVLLVKTEEEAAKAKMELEDLQAEKLQHQTLLTEVKKVSCVENDPCLKVGHAKNDPQ